MFFFNTVLCDKNNLYSLDKSKFHRYLLWLSIFSKLSKLPFQFRLLTLKDFFNKCKQIRNFLRFFPHLLKKLLTEASFFVQ